MEYKEFSAKTLDEAITMATVELGITSDRLEYDVVDKGSGGILGFGRKDVTIQVREKSNESVIDEVKTVTKTEPVESMDRKEEEKEALSKDEITKIVVSFLDDMFRAMDLEVEHDITFSDEDGSLSIDLSGPQMGLLIGKRGQTLDAIQFLTNLVVNKQSNTYIRVKMDTEDYRNRRKETLENLARNIASKVKRSGKSVSLEAMNPYERRTIHFALQGDDEIDTFSEGTDPYRHVVVTLKK